MDTSKELLDYFNTYLNKDDPLYLEKLVQAAYNKGVEDENAAWWESQPRVC